MLVIKRRNGERLAITLGGQVVWVQVLETWEGSARLGIDAPQDVVILREEIMSRNRLNAEVPSCPKPPPA